jgi:hypothetical protein
MKLLNEVIVVAAVAMVAMTQRAQAAYDFGTTATLYQLENTSGGELTIGDKVFSDFTSTEFNMVAGNGDPADIQVTVSQVGSSYFLKWTGDIAEVLGGEPAGDLTLGYTVAATDGEIYAIDQSYTGTSGANPGTILSVAETATIPGTTTVAATSDLNATIISTSYTATGAILNPAQAALDISKDINLYAGNNPNNFLDISVVEQSFEQVPEASTVLAGALLLLPLGASTLRILRRNRIA